MADTTKKINKVIHPHSSELNKIPDAARIDKGELYINTNSTNPFIGTKDSEGNVISFAQLNQTQKDALFDGNTGKFVPLKGNVLTQLQSSYKENLSGNIVIDDNSDNVIKRTVSTNIAIIVNKTSGHKVTQIILEKPATASVTITWQGIDYWRVVNKPPVFGESSEKETLIVAILSTPELNGGNVVYNSESPVLNDDVIMYWGNIEGDINQQLDLMNILNKKAENSVVLQLVDRVTQLEQQVSDLRVENLSLYNQIDNVDDNVTSLATDTAKSISTLQNNINTVSTKVDTTTDEINNNITVRLDDVVDTIDNDITVKLNDVTDDLATTNSNVATLQSDLATTNTNLTNTQKDVSDLSKSLKSNVATLTTGLESANSEIATTKTNVATLTTNLETTNNNVANLTTGLEETNTNVSTLNNTAIKTGSEAVVSKLTIE